MGSSNSSAAGLDASRDHAERAEGTLLAGIGVLGVLTLPLRPVVYALVLVPPAGGAAWFALFGLGWIALGVRSVAETPAVAPKEQ